MTLRNWKVAPLWAATIAALVLAGTITPVWGHGGGQSPPQSGSECKLTLPSEPVNFYADGGVTSFALVQLSGVPSGFSVENAVYAGWCVDYPAPVAPFGANLQARLYNSLDANLPAHLQNENWDLVNYILNHKQGTRDEIQGAIWFVTDGATEGFTSVSQAMVDDAMANGQGFRPGVGQIVAVLLDPVSTNPAGRIQQLAIEVICKEHDDDDDDGEDHEDCDDFVTGGGWIKVSGGNGKATFAVQGGMKNGSLWGGLNYIDHGTKMHVKGTTVTAYEKVDENTRIIRYNTKVGRESGTAVVTVTDNGEPGRDDIFRIELSSGYSAGGDLGGSRPGGGNIQLHQKCKHHDGRDCDDHDGKCKGGKDRDGKDKDCDDDDDDDGGKGKDKDKDKGKGKDENKGAKKKDRNDCD